jgi:hypothetical protein
MTDKTVVDRDPDSGKPCWLLDGAVVYFVWSQSDFNTLYTAIAEWAVERRQLSADEEADGHDFDLVNRWEASDDKAVELLAVVCRTLEERRGTKPC